jgi:hypothetical protein
MYLEVPKRRVFTVPVTFEKVPIGSGKWLYAEADGKPQVGAFMPAGTDPEAGEPNLTIFWHGSIATTNLSNIVKDVEAILRNFGDVQGTLVAYGADRKELGPTSEGLSSYLDQYTHGYDAYRAELQANAFKTVVWANVAANPKTELSNGGENIGLCFTPPGLFDGAARSVVAAAIEKTVLIKRKTVDELLEEISRAMLHDIAVP